MIIYPNRVKFQFSADTTSSIVTAPGNERKRGRPRKYAANKTGNRSTANAKVYEENESSDSDVDGEDIEALERRKLRTIEVFGALQDCSGCRTYKAKKGVHARGLHIP